MGEIDIVARDRDTLVFVEVKTRSGGTAGSPVEAVNRPKQRKLVLLARTYLVTVPGEPPPCRFDVIAVEFKGAIPRIRHLRAAFRADGVG